MLLIDVLQVSISSRYLCIIVLEYEWRYSVSIVTNIVKQLIIVLSLEVIPLELCITLLWPHCEQIESPYLSRNSSDYGIISEYSSTSRFRKLGVLVIQILSGWYVMQECPWVLSSKEGWREDHCVEWDIILSHELEELNIFRILPPLLPMVGIICCDWDIPYRCIKPNIEHLILEFLYWDGSTPFKVPSNATASQTSLDPRLSCSSTVITPESLHWALINKLFKIRLKIGKIEEDVVWWLFDWCFVTSLAFGVYQLNGIDQLSTCVTLISLSIVCLTLRIRASSIDKPISQELITSLTLQLLYLILICELILLTSLENALRDVGLLLSGCSPKVFEVTIEPLIYLLMNSIIMIAYLLTCLPFLLCFRLSCSSILISPTNIHSIMPSQSAVSGKDICREHTPNNVPKMRHIVNIRQCWCH